MQNSASLQVELEFTEKLQGLVGKELQVRLNNNRSTMLHVRWEAQKTKVSLHRMFLEAPHAVQHALACYISREDRVLSPSVKAYIEKHKPKVAIDHGILVAEGAYFHLQNIYDSINQHYFKGSLNLKITWHGSEKRRYRARCNLGLYVDSQKLIKIHRMLDHSNVPAYIIEYVVYHEMVHAIVPAYVDKDGINRMHSVEFKQIEGLFLHFKPAKEWLKRNRRNFFLPQKDRFRWPDIVNGQTSSIKKQRPTPKKARSLLAYLKKLLTL